MNDGLMFFVLGVISTIITTLVFFKLGMFQKKSDINLPVPLYLTEHESTAYLLAHFDISGDKPVFMSVGIYSTDPQNLTMMGGEVALIVLEETGKDYEDARRKLKAHAEALPMYYGWAMDAFKGAY